MTIAPADDVAVAPAPGAAPMLDRRRAWRGAALVVGVTFAALGMALGMVWLLWRLSWPHVEPLGPAVFGINYSCNYAEYLLLEEADQHVDDDRPGREAWCAATLGELLRSTGARHVRLSVEWSQVEPTEGVYDFALLDALLAEAERHDARVLLTVGIKAQRHPEYYLPAWLLVRVEMPARNAVITDDPSIREPALRMAAAVVRHAAASPAVDAWGAENEPYVPSKRAHWWRLGRPYVQSLAAVIRANDPLRRPVAINQGQHHLFDTFETRWQEALEDADVLAVSLYPFRNFEVLGWPVVVPITELGPFVPNYAAQRRAADTAGREYWITEMQAEPWIDDDPRLRGPDNPHPNLTHDKFRRNIEYARRTGAQRVYLWGAEWWLMQRQRFGDDSWLRQAQQAITASLARASEEE